MTIRERGRSKVGVGKKAKRNKRTIFAGKNMWDFLESGRR